MNVFNPQSHIPPSMLATDLDGTLIPLLNNKENQKALLELSSYHKAGNFNLVYATGRHFESTLKAIIDYNLPHPEWIVCDVGSSIYQQKNGKYQQYTPYEEHLIQCTCCVNRQQVEQALLGITDLTLQPPDHQQRFKISYQCSSEVLNTLCERIRTRLTSLKISYECIGSIDPFMQRGLIDVLPIGVSKAYALLWLSSHADFSPDEVIYSGDSGNDYAAMVSGFRTIIVGNGTPDLINKVKQKLKQRNLTERLFIAEGEATTGVLEGCRHFKLI